MSRILIAIAVLITLGCQSGEDMVPLADAANRASGGEASGKSGSLTTKFTGGYTTTGDLTNNAQEVNAQRNNTVTKAGDVYNNVSLAVGGGPKALQEAIEADPIVSIIRAEIASLNESTAESRPVERIRELTAELKARVREIEAASAKATPSVTISGATQTVTAPSNTGTPAPDITANDVEASKGIKPIVDAITSRPSDDQ